MGEIEVSQVTVVHKAALRSQTLLYQTLHARWNENDIHNFMKTVGFLQKYSDIYKKRFPFWNVQCSCLFNNVKAFWNINLWRSVLILWWAATNKSKYGKHLCHEHKLTLGFWFWHGRSGHHNRSHWPVEYLYQRAGSSGRPGSQMGSTKTFTSE